MISQDAISVRTAVGAHLRLVIHQMPPDLKRWASAELTRGPWPHGKRLVFAIAHELKDLRLEPHEEIGEPPMLWIGSACVDLSTAAAASIEQWFTDNSVPDVSGADA